MNLETRSKPTIPAARLSRSRSQTDARARSASSAPEAWRRRAKYEHRMLGTCVRSSSVKSACLTALSFSRRRSSAGTQHFYQPGTRGDPCALAQALHLTAMLPIFAASRQRSFILKKVAISIRTSRDCVCSRSETGLSGRLSTSSARAARAGVQLGLLETRATSWSRSSKSAANWSANVSAATRPPQYSTPLARTREGSGSDELAQFRTSGAEACKRLNSRNTVGDAEPAADTASRRAARRLERQD